MRTVDPAKHAARRQQILDAAAALFAQKGFERTTTADICTRAGMSTGNLFHYFPSKRAIFAAMFEDDGKANEARLAAAAASADPLQAILDLVEALAEPATQPDYAGLALEVIAHANRDQDFAMLLDQNDRAIQAGLTALLARASAKGQINPGLDTSVTAAWIGTLIDARYLRAASEPDTSPEEDMRVLRLLVTRFLQVQPPR